MNVQTLYIDQQRSISSDISEIEGRMEVVPLPHVVLFPFMSQGHTIPILHLARLLRRRLLCSVTLLTTPANSPSIRSSLQDTSVSVVDLPCLPDIPGLPPGIESTDALPSMFFFRPFLEATKLLQPHFERVILSLPAVHCIVSDGFLGWSQQSAEKLGIPWVCFYGMSNYVVTLCEIMLREKPHERVASAGDFFTVPGLPGVEVTAGDFQPPFGEIEPNGPVFDFVAEARAAVFRSHGLLVNSFYEPRFNDYWNQKIGPKAWCVGPLCLAEPPTVRTHQQRPAWVQWLDDKAADGKAVLYVAFGSQAEMGGEQLREIATGLERSESTFLWVLRTKGGLEKEEEEFLEGFEERVKGRGVVVRKWVEQRAVLAHHSVKGFMSHCGWNSVMESVCAGVPILALPLMAEQHLNARMVADELGVALRVSAADGSVRGLVEAKAVEKMVRELMGMKMVGVRRKVKEVGEAARAAMEDGGSSFRTLDIFIRQICNKKPNLHL